MAFGANRSNVLAMVMRAALLLVVIGIAIGIPIALLGARAAAAASLFYGVRPYDPVTLGIATLVLVTSATVAAVIPANRAAGLEPMQALRTE
jgi:ABC-type antimicrobial peptide transport system permease subunit